LTYLSLWDNKISDKGAIGIGEGLKINTTLTKLDLQWNNISDKGAIGIGEGLKINTTLTSLNLFNNEISDKGAIVIGEGLKINTTLTELNLHSNNISDEGAIVIGEGLKINTTLTLLNLEYNKISDEGYTHIAKCLAENRSHQTNKPNEEYLEDFITNHIRKMVGIDVVSYYLQIEWIPVPDDLLVESKPPCEWLVHKGAFHHILALVERFSPLKTYRAGKNFLHYLSETPFDAELHADEIQQAHLEATKKLFHLIPAEWKDEKESDRKDICVHTAWPLLRQWARSLGTKYNRYKMDHPVQPIYRSKTCEVYYATDVLSETLSNARVCLKIIRDRINFDSELNSRSSVTLDPNFVVEVLDGGFLTDEATRAFREATGFEATIGAPSWENDAGIDEFALVMPCADRNLHGVISDERFAGYDPEKARLVAKDVANALRHMHDNGLVHGDIKPRNIVRIDESWKLIDLDAAGLMNQPIGRKYSSGYSPPELAKLLFTRNGESVNSVRGAPSQSAALPQPPPKEDTLGPDRARKHPSLKETARIKIISFGSFLKRKLVEEAKPTFDVWSFGCVLYFLCAGRSLFSDMDASDDNIYEASSAKELMGWSEIDNKRLSFVFQEVPEDNLDKAFAKDLIRKCLRGDPAKRLQGMGDVLNHPYFSSKARDEVIRRESSVGTRGTGTKVKEAENLRSDEFYPDGSYAVIVAIDDYESAGVEVGFKNLRCAVADAKMMRETLESRGFTVLEELLNSDATMASVKALMGSAKKKLKGKKRARFVFFLASHGYLEDDEAWMCCHGADMEDLEGTCIELKSLKSLSGRLDCSHQLFVLDCCHAGGLFAGTRGKPTKYEKALMGSPAVYGMTAVTEAQEAMEANGHGLFTQSIVDALNGNAFSPAVPYISANQMFTYASKSVFEAADQKDHTQTPKFEPLLQMHKKMSCDGQFLFFKKK
jgi:serine/threonine protein kinase